jgi:pyruvate ferredoxin oxidoreductase gamma subunit
MYSGSMIEIRVHGRGGMGSITLVELLAKAVGFDDKYSQAFGAFGPERRGAPVRAFCRIDDSYILKRTQIHNPDYVIVLDPTLMDLPELQEGITDKTIFIVNSKKPDKQPDIKNKIHYFDATSLALDIIGKDIVNTAMLGVFAKITGMVTLDSIFKVIDTRFGGAMAKFNRQLVQKAFDNTKV